MTSMSYTSDNAYFRQYNAPNDRSAASRPQAVSVSQAMAICKGSLERIRLTVEGEVSEASDKPGYKACYFTIKDASASLPCMMWKDQYQRSGIVLEVGMKVQISGRFSAYVKKGRMNFSVFGLELAGRGRLYAQIKATEDKLRREGLMSANRKRPIPRFPKTVGVVTSPRGAAVHDVLRTLARRFPLANVLVAGVPVEGPDAPNNMVQALHALVNAQVRPEVILLVRGGGSFEDLMPFNDERLARAVAACPVPVITGIGHEPDNSIADEVADLRQSTPTGAAEAAVPSQEELYQTLDSDLSGMTRTIEGKISEVASSLDRIERHPMFANPKNLFAAYVQSLSLAQRALERDFPRSLHATKDKTNSLGMRLASALPAYTIHAQSRIDQIQTRMNNDMARTIDARRMRLAATTHALESLGSSLIDQPKQKIAMRAARLQDLSPLNVLSRGYAITRDADRNVVHSVARVSSGDAISVQLQDGVMDCHVDSVEATPMKK